METIMKTTQSVTNARNGKVTLLPRQVAPALTQHPILLSPVRTDRSRIQWPTGDQIQDVSKQLARISRQGKRFELAGDYFMSGDLAFQLQEIIRATRELLKKIQRTKP